MYQLVREVVGFQLVGGDFQTLKIATHQLETHNLPYKLIQLPVSDVICGFFIEYVVCSDHAVHRSVRVFLSFCVVDRVLHPVGGYMFDRPPVCDVFDHS